MAGEVYSWRSFVLLSTYARIPRIEDIYKCGNSKVATLEEDTYTQTEG